MSNLEPTHEKFVQSNDTYLWTIQQGYGLPLLLCNGGPGACDYLAPVATMVDTIARVIRWEQRGCGRSSHHPPYDLITCIEDMEQIRQAYALEQWFVGGHSWGANLALAYALAHPDRVRGLLYLAGTGITEAWKPAYRRARDSRGEQRPLFQYPSSDDVNRVGNASWSHYLTMPTLRQQLQSLHIPALIVCGGQDIRPNWPSEEVAQHLPQATYHVIENAPHYLWLTHADALAKLLHQFLTRFDRRN